MCFLKSPEELHLDLCALEFLNVSLWSGMGGKKGRQERKINFTFMANLPNTENFMEEDTEGAKREWRQLTIITIRDEGKEREKETETEKYMKSKNEKRTR